jgi:hypothetical protein
MKSAISPPLRSALAAAAFSIAAVRSCALSWPSRLVSILSNRASARASISALVSGALGGVDSACIATATPAVSIALSAVAVSNVFIMGSISGRQGSPLMLPF